MGGLQSTDDDHLFLLCRSTELATLPRFFFIPGFRPAGKRSSLFSFIVGQYFHLRIGSCLLAVRIQPMERLLRLLLQDPRVCESPMANFADMQQGEHWTDCIYMRTTPVKDYLQELQYSHAWCFLTDLIFFIRACVTDLQVPLPERIPRISAPRSIATGQYQGHSLWNIGWIWTMDISTSTPFWIAIHWKQHYCLDGLLRLNLTNGQMARQPWITSLDTTVYKQDISRWQNIPA
ncbi:hypothetical protein GGR53DRAFT_294369 [Hypoxylon sp. FL1150]|nr:hypothetical protein GGR53DRAFT_294369 [Hypoxylon sp. FL1150]